MNREILFRGFHPCDDGGTTIYVDGGAVKGQWVEGSHVIQDDIEKIYYDIPDKEWNIYPVLPSTVGQYTGLADKSGKRIFEGDICHVGSLNYKVAFRYSEWRFEIISKLVYCYPNFDSHCGERCEIIGTKWDS